MTRSRYSTTVAPTTVVLNCGSSSVKYQLFEHDRSILRGSIDNIGTSGCVHKKTNENEDYVSISIEVGFMDAIEKAVESILSVRKEIACVGHRVVHGGPSLTQATLVTPSTLDEIRNTSTLAPLHNPSNIAGIEIAQRAMTDVPQVACFDTAFHSHIPSKAYTYAIPRDLTDKHRIRRYGFHGLSYAYVSQLIPERRIIIAHLGSGCSAAAIVDKQSIDTTMGFTPMEGLVMSTRSGSVDPGLILHLAKQHGGELESISTLLNKKSGLLGVSGFSMDMKQLLEVEKQAFHPHAKHAHEAVQVYVYSVQKHIGMLLASLGFDVDAIVFTGGIGENSSEIRRRVLNCFTSLGARLDSQRNENPSNDGVISIDNSPIKVYAVKTDEEKQIAREAMRVVQLS